MIIDASALLAILFDEPEVDRFTRLIHRSAHPAISPVNFLEAGIRADNPKTPAKGPALDTLMIALGIEVASVTAEQAQMAREAYRHFGEGNHPARLNLGDCFAYALAKAHREPLLFKGDDFVKTDIEAAA